MRHNFIIILALAMLAGCGSSPQDTKASNGEEARNGSLTNSAGEVVDTFHAALKAGDTEKAMALLADDVLIYEGGGAEKSKAEYASHHLAADIAFVKEMKQSTSARSATATGDMVLVTSQGVTTGTYKDEAINSRSTETMVLRRIDGQWKIVHIHWSSADIKPSAPTS
jgi:ketosteroid isomerase-like protein